MSFNIRIPPQKSSTLRAALHSTSCYARLSLAPPASLHSTGTTSRHSRARTHPMPIRQCSCLAFARLILLRLANISTCPEKVLLERRPGHAYFHQHHMAQFAFIRTSRALLPTRSFARDLNFSPLTCQLKVVCRSGLSQTPHSRINF